MNEESSGVCLKDELANTLLMSICFSRWERPARQQIANNYAVTVVWAQNQKGQEYFRPFCWSAEILWKNRKGKQSFPQAVCELSSVALSISLSFFLKTTAQSINTIKTIRKTILAKALSVYLVTRKLHQQHTCVQTCSVDTPTLTDSKKYAVRKV